MSELPNLPGMGLLTELETLTDADARDLGSAQLSVLRKLFETLDEGIGLFLFCRTIFSYRDLTLEVHLPVCRLLSMWGASVFADGFTTYEVPNDSHIRAHGEVTENYRRLMVRIPRETFKTSLCTRANPVWQIARDPLHNPTFGIFNEKADNAQKWVEAITRVLENSRLFQLLWPEMLPRGVGLADQEKGITKPRNIKWGAGGILFERDDVGLPEFSIEPHGVGGAVTGKHYTHKILDDIIGKEAAYSPAVMQSAIDWVNNSRPLEKPAENGCELVPHTPWGYNDVYSHMLKHWPGEYRVYTRALLENELGEPDIHTGTSIVPFKMSTTKAKALFDNKEKRFINFSQYQCQPQMSRDQSFDIEWIKYGTVMERGQSPVFKILPEHFDPMVFDLECGDLHAPMVCPLSWMSKALILDPAPSKPNDIKKQPGAGNGIAVVGKDPWGRRYLLEARSEHETPNRILEILHELSVKWCTDLIGIEEVNFSMVYAPLYTELIQYKYPDWRPQFFPLSTKGWRKPDRIKNKLIGPMESGLWVFNTHGTAPAVRELMEFGVGTGLVDVVDSFSYTDDILHRPESPDETSRKFVQRFQDQGDRGLTGYGRFFASDSGAMH